MNIKRQGFLTSVFMLVLATFLALPMVAFGQGNGKNQGRGKPTEVFVNGHDARDGRWDKDNNNRNRQNRNNDDWRRRNRDDRWDNDNDRRNGRNRSNDGYGNYGGSFDLRQTALNAGFADGAKEGRRDRSRNEGFNFSDESGFQRATRDYSSRLGSRELFQTYYRQAFENGYRDGFAGY